MNREHLELCSSDRWRTHLGTNVVPWALDRVPPIGDLLEIGPGPGAATEVLRRHATALTAVEFDAALAATLADRYAGDPTVRVEHGDATALDVPDGSFDAAASFTMLHHVPSAAAQDAVFAEMARVLRPGGTFFGVDSLAGPSFFALHHDDICVPLDPRTLADRLEAAGFIDVDLALRGDGVRWLASVPETDGTRVRLNAGFTDLYRGDDMARIVRTDWVPSLLELAGLGDDPLHLTAGPASAAPLLRAAAPRLTVAQLDSTFTAELTDRWRDDPDVEVCTVDPTRLPFPDGRFSAATVLLALVHLRSARAQDAALAELARVLRPGAPLLGLSALDGSHFRALNTRDRALPLDPLTLPDRLRAAGFTDPHVDLWGFPRFLARA